MNILRKLAVVVVVLASVSVAQADPIEISGTSIHDGIWEVTLVEGTVGGLLPLLEEQVWWEDQELAKIFAQEVGLSLGGPNHIGLPGDGPFFGFGTGETVDEYVGAFQVIAVSEGGGNQSLQCHYPEPCAYVDYTWATATRSVPEPGTFALLGIGLFGMGLSRRKKA